MKIKEQLTEKKAALVELEPQLKSEEVTDEMIAQGEALVSEIASLEEQIAKAEKAAEVLKAIGTKSEDTNTDITEVKTMSTIEEFAKRCTEMVDRKSGTSIHFEKAYNTTVTAPQIADIDRSVAPQAGRTAAASFFTNATISGNAITYFKQGAFETQRGISSTAQGNKKPQASTSFTGTTLALSKLAATSRRQTRSSLTLRSWLPKFRTHSYISLDAQRTASSLMLSLILPVLVQQNMTEQLSHSQTVSLRLS